LSSAVKCPVCGGGLLFIRVRKFGDLYHCIRGAKVCPGVVLHYRRAGTTQCGWARLFDTGRPDEWIRCSEYAEPRGD
jgi:hypothetical protein